MRTKNKCRMLLAAIFLICALVLTGCVKYSNTENDMKNVEERDYATILLITQGEDKKDYHFVLGIAQEKKVGEKSMTEQVSEWDCDDLRELAKGYSSVKGKDLSLAHLKIILISGNETATGMVSPAVAADEEENVKFQNLLCMLDENEEVTKTCPVLLLSEPKVFLEYLEQEDKPVGNYFENLVRESERRGQEVTWLKDYLKAMRECTPIEPFVLQYVSEGWTIDKEKRQFYLYSEDGL